MPLLLTALWSHCARVVVPQSLGRGALALGRAGVALGNLFEEEGGHEAGGPRSRGHFLELSRRGVGW